MKVQALLCHSSAQSSDRLLQSVCWQDCCLVEMAVDDDLAGFVQVWWFSDFSFLNVFEISDFCHKDKEHKQDDNVVPVHHIGNFNAQPQPKRVQDCSYYDIRSGALSLE